VSDTPLSLRGALGLAVAHEAVDLMARHDVPPTPQNYEVWLSYRLGGHPDLRKQIESRIAEQKPFTDDVNADLYDSFFSTARLSQQMLSTGERIARELGEVVQTLQAAGDEAGAYGQTLQSAAQRIEQGVDAQSLRHLVASLASATMSMAESNKKLTTRLNDSSREMDSLRTALHQVRAEALTDGLTGLSNRKMFDETLRMRIAEAAGLRLDLSLMMCDIDHFKRFNDTWGHQTGDQIIRFIAASLQRVAKPDFCVARYGGEEFAIVMPRTRIVEARSVAEQVRMTVESKKLYRKSTNEDLGKVTVSVGIAALKFGETPESLIERADSCLYASKRSGRNRVTLESELPKRAL
jgi:diguanylate cyclase